MLDRIQAFFADDHERRDQAYAEAAIQLLLLAMYSDGTLTLAERRFLEEFGSALPWHGTASKERFIGAAFAKVREVHAKQMRVPFLRTLAAQVPSAEDRLRLYTACHRLLKTDGAMPAAEQAFIADVKTGLGID